MLSAKVRSSQGCWTCRLRRKKCDEIRPICYGCSSLEITCHFGDAKPDWMDGGPRQKEMASLLKRQVKVQANHRRERKYLQSFELAASAPDYDDTGSDSEHVSPPSAANSSSHPASSASPSSQNTPPDAFQFDSVKQTMPESSPAPAPWEADQVSDENEMNFVMVYFDHVLPYFFPLYRPTMLEGGRGWVLSLLRSNKAAYHTALSLSSYFATRTMSAVEGVDGPCQANARNRLQEQQSLALQELQSDMTGIVGKGVTGNLKESIRVLNSIIHLLIFDVAVTRSGQWCIHMSAAISIFKQIIPDPNLWSDRIHQLGYFGSIDTTVPRRQTIPWTTEQAAMRTFGAALFVLDVLASTAAERRPHLQDFHAAALDLAHIRDPSADSRPLIRFEDLFGMQTWVMHVVGEIAALDAWKKEQRKQGTLSVSQLVSRAAVLEQALRQGIDCLSGQCPLMACPETGNGCRPKLPHPIHQEASNTDSKLDLLALYGRFNAAERNCLIPIYTKIWAYGALTYLSVVVSGWQPASEDIAVPVTAALELFDLFPSPICTRVVVWPFFVVGCLSPPQARDKFRDIAAKMESMDLFGTVSTAMKAMETVWQRGDIHDEQWDIAACLQSLGHPVLLL